MTSYQILMRRNNGVEQALSINYYSGVMKSFVVFFVALISALAPIYSLHSGTAPSCVWFAGGDGNARPLGFPTPYPPAKQIRYFSQAYTCSQIDVQ